MSLMIPQVYNMTGCKACSFRAQRIGSKSYLLKIVFGSKCQFLPRKISFRANEYQAVGMCLNDLLQMKGVGMINSRNESLFRKAQYFNQWP